MISTIKNLIGGVTGANDPYKKADEISKKYADALNTQYAAGIQNLEDQKKGLALTYDPQRASVNAQYERGVRNNEEQMANLGLTRSGTNLTSQLALDTERQRGIAEVNTTQDQAAQKLQAQINEYMAQRDSEIAQQSARLYENAYNTEMQFAHDKEMAALEHKYNQQMATLQLAYDIALSKNDHAQTAALQKEMAALEHQYNIERLEKQNALNWDTYQKQAALDNQYAINLYNSKAATDWNYTQKKAALEGNNPKPGDDNPNDDDNGGVVYPTRGIMAGSPSNEAIALATELLARFRAGEDVHYEDIRAGSDSLNLSEKDMLWLINYFNL